MVRRPFKLACTIAVLALISLCPTASRAQDLPLEGSDEPIYDPLDPFDLIGSEEIISSDKDDEKSAEELLRDGVLLLQLDRPLDARTKLLKALKKDPDNYRSYNLLAGYYLIHVGHYRLALKYIKRAEELFEKDYGPPPYRERLIRKEHSNLLYYLAQARLNLDNYEGALEILDRYAQLGYHDDWYPGSRAWVLMKLGNIQEAIKVARLGVLAGPDGARTLNMLGILLSMNDQPQESLEVFRQAIAYELTLGSEGQPGTPLNNSGEVYKELFEDEKAESTFLRATSFRDGCEHILPSLNLTLLYVEQVKYEAAISIMDNFDKCIAQFPLRNNEEHMALENLARGRIDLHTGNVDRAIKRLEASLEGTQWFGKIGTNQDDMLVGATISLAQALRAQNNILRSTIAATWGEWVAAKETITSNSLRAWWLMRRARQMLVEDLKDIEDLTIRNTDSLLEYPTLGDVLSGFSSTGLSARLARQLAVDSRPRAQLFYKAYSAQANRSLFSRSGSGKMLDEVIEQARPRFEDLLQIQAMALRMESLKPLSDRYRDLAYRIFYIAPAELRNRGLKLPIQIERRGLPDSLPGLLEDGPFLDGGSSGSLCIVQAAAATEPNGATSISFSCPGNTSFNRTVRGVDPGELVNKLSDALFREEIRNGSNS